MAHVPMQTASNTIGERIVTIYDAPIRSIVYNDNTIVSFHQHACIADAEGYHDLAAGIVDNEPGRITDMLTRVGAQVIVEMRALVGQEQIAILLQ